MRYKKLIILLFPLLISGCSFSQEEIQEYQAVTNQSVMDATYREHTSNQGYLSSYSYKETVSYDPTYDLFGELAPEGTKNSYFDETTSVDINLYSGYFIRKENISTYEGNKSNVGSKNNSQFNQAYWFKDSENNKNMKDLIFRYEWSENGVSYNKSDYNTGIEIETSKVSNYFSNNINTIYFNRFPMILTRPTATTTRTVSAFYKSENEIVETTSEVVNWVEIKNPFHPIEETVVTVEIQNPSDPDEMMSIDIPFVRGEEYKLTTYKSTTTSTTFKKVDRIGWIGTEYKEDIEYGLTSDYELNSLSEPRIIKKESKSISFTYMTNVQPYSGEAFVYQEVNPKLELFSPILHSYDAELDKYESLNELYYPAEITAEYTKLNSNFKGYAYHFDNVKLEKGKNYCFARYGDLVLETPKYESYGYSHISENILKNIVSSNVTDHNLFRTIDEDETYEFIILVSMNGECSIIVRMC